MFWAISIQYRSMFTFKATYHVNKGIYFSFESNSDSCLYATTLTVRYVEFNLPSFSHYTFFKRTVDKIRNKLIHSNMKIIQLFNFHAYLCSFLVFKGWEREGGGGGRLQNSYYPARYHCFSFILEPYIWSDVIFHLVVPWINRTCHSTYCMKHP